MTVKLRRERETIHTNINPLREIHTLNIDRDSITHINLNKSQNQNSSIKKRKWK